jgi:hypothetical protein
VIILRAIKIWLYPSMRKEDFISSTKKKEVELHVCKLWRLFVKKRGVISKKFG